ncbi:flagellar motor protein MotB [Bacillus ndiopicus]|uniref:flagellar motor protein MotB n=1 Tax=Bacillus ndiopicus TaxID=1347368 RepID=UPI0005A8B78B|nr:flagellar motor protein MotB [Bacillus ndiopicus]
MAKKHKKHKKHEEHIDESWLVPYADILTLLLALFIVLFASSSVDQQKLERMSEVFSQIFDGGVGVMENPSATPDPNATSSEITDQTMKYIRDQEELQGTLERIEEFIAINELEEQFEVIRTDTGGVLIIIRDSVLFDPGRADVKVEYSAIAQDLSKILQTDTPRNILVKGHTDNVPMNNAQFSSNWDLSAMRASNFLESIIDNNPELDPSYFSVIGEGEYKPIADNDTAEGRAKNRRVEVLIQPLVLEDGSDINK